MGNPKFYFFPEPSGSRLFTIEIPETLAEMFHEFKIDSASSVSYDGSQHVAVGANRRVITIQRDKFKGAEDLAIKFEALQNHLDNGYSCAFSADSSKSWCYPVLQTPRSGDQSIQLGGDPFVGAVGSYSPSPNEYCNIISEQPRPSRSTNKIDSSWSSLGWVPRSGGQLDFANRIEFSDSRPTWVHWYRYFPVLKRLEEDRGKPIVTNEHGVHFSLNIRLVIDYGTWFQHHPLVGAYGTQSPSWVSENGSPDGAITIDRSIRGWSYRKTPSARRTQIDVTW